MSIIYLVVERLRENFIKSSIKTFYLSGWHPHPPSQAQSLNQYQIFKCVDLTSLQSMDFNLRKVIISA